MRITNVRIHPVSNSPRLKGYATIVFDRAIAINDVRIVQADRGLCVEFPKDRFSKAMDSESIVPLNRQARDYIESKVLKAYSITSKSEQKEA